MIDAGNNQRLIVGLGVSGLSTARYCQRMGWSFDLADSRARPPSLASVEQEFPLSKVFCGALDATVLCRYKQLIVSPGIALAEPALQAAMAAGVEIVGDIELFARVNRKPVLAITGSNGKSTVTTLVRDMLRDAGIRAEMGGNIGVPILDLVGTDRPNEVDVWVLELSSFQLETTASLECAAATLLNLSEDHMDRYFGMAAYAAAKQRIFDHASRAVVNRDDPASVPERAGIDSIGFGLAPAVSGFGLEQDGDGAWILYQGLRLIHSREIRIKGRHNLANAMAALALVEAVGVAPTTAVSTLRTFAGLDHRCQWVAEHAGVYFINDSKGTNVGSTLAALNGLGPESAGKIWLLAGGDGKGQDFAPLREPCAAYCAAVICFGRDGQRLADGLQDVVNVSRTETLAEAFALAAAAAVEGDLVLLSPACASLDQFRNYVERGLQFRALAEAACN